MWAEAIEPSVQQIVDTIKDTIEETPPELVADIMDQGIVLAGLPPVAMAYLSEEIEPATIGAAMGIYIGGNAIGGMSGRLFTAAVTDYFSWHWLFLINVAPGIAAAATVAVLVRVDVPDFALPVIWRTSCRPLRSMKSRIPAITWRAVCGS